MSLDNSEIQRFMLELYQRTNGDIEVQVSMYDVGAALGLEKNEASALSQDLMIDDLVEMKTLSGGVGITRKGLDLLRREGLIAGSSAQQLAQLSCGPIMDDQDRQLLDNLLMEIRSSAFSTQNGFTHLEELVIDLKTLETQLLSPRPKLAIARAILASLKNSLEMLGHNESSSKIESLIRK